MDAGAVSVEVKKEDEENWVNHCIEKSMLRKKFLEDCTPGYYNLEGEISRLAARNTTYGAGPMVYRQVLEDWKAEGSMKGLELKMAA